MCFWIESNGPNAAAARAKGYKLWQTIESKPVYQLTRAEFDAPPDSEGIRPSNTSGGYPILESLFKLKGIPHTTQQKPAPQGQYFIQPVVERGDGRTDEKFCTAFATEREAQDDYNAHSGTQYAARMFWSVYHRRDDGTAEALSDHPDELQAETLLRHLQRGALITETQKIETFYDLVWDAGFDFGQGKQPAALGDDSRARMDILLEWANEFNQRHAMTDWSDDEHDGEYLSMIDNFYAEKTKE